MICQKYGQVMFADDTCLLYTGDNLEDLTHHVNERLKIIFEWCCQNKLCVNPEKCSYMLFTTKNVEVDPPIKLNEESLMRAESFQYLGVIMGKNLK